MTSEATRIPRGFIVCKEWLKKPTGCLVSLVVPRGVWACGTGACGSQACVSEV